VFVGLGGHNDGKNGCVSRNGKKILFLVFGIKCSKGESKCPKVWDRILNGIKCPKL